jgi:hypothetical protein
VEFGQIFHQCMYPKIDEYDQIQTISQGSEWYSDIKVVVYS